MKNKYERPEAELITFDYTENVVASNCECPIGPGHGYPPGPGHGHGRH